MRLHLTNKIDASSNDKYKKLKINLQAVIQENKNLIQEIEEIKNEKAFLIDRLSKITSTSEQEILENMKNHKVPSAAEAPVEAPKPTIAKTTTSSKPTTDIENNVNINHLEPAPKKQKLIKTPKTKRAISFASGAPTLPLVLGPVTLISLGEISLKPGYHNEKVN